MVPNSAIPSLTPVAIDVATTDSTVLVAGEEGTQICVAQLFYQVQGDSSVSFLHGNNNDDTDDELFHPPLVYPSGTGLVLDPVKNPWYVCPDGEAFRVQLSNAVQLAGMVYYARRRVDVP